MEHCFGQYLFFRCGSRKTRFNMTVLAAPIRVMDFRGTYKGGGGPDKTILMSASQHNPARVRVLVTYLRQPEDTEFEIPEKAKSLGIEYVDIEDKYLLDWQCLKQLWKLIRESKVKILHCHDDKTLLYSVILKYLVPGLRIMHTCHSHAEYERGVFARSLEYRKFLMRKKLQLWLMKQHLKPVVTISNDTRQRLIRGGLRPEHVMVLYNGIDVEQWVRQKGKPVLRKELGLTEHDILVGTVARITYDKDLTTFFQVARQVKAQIPTVKFVIVGDGYANELKEAKVEASALGLDKTVFFTGHRSDLLDVYASFDIFLMTSLTEGLPNTILEAMAMKVPVVSTAVGGVPEVIREGQDGILCPVGDVMALTNAVLTLLRGPELRSQMAENSRKSVEKKFNFSKRVQLLEELYLYFAGSGTCPVL